MKYTLTYGITLTALLTACSGSPGVGIEVKASTVTATNPTQTDLVLLDQGGATYAVQTAYLRLRHIELDLPDGSSCDDMADSLEGAECDGTSGKIRIPGPFDVDLVTGQSTPSLDTVEIPTGVYKRIDFRVEDNPSDVAFAVTAGFNYEGSAHTLELGLDFNEDIRVDDPAGISVDEGSNLIAQFVVNDWLGGVDIGACIDDGDVRLEGTTVFIDDSSTSGSCSAIEDTIKSNMKRSAQLDRD